MAFNERYINPYTDFGFKKLFGTELNKAALQERIFTRLFEQAEIAKFSPEDQRQYEDSIKADRDITNAINTARMEAKLEGKEETQIETARKMKSDGLASDFIAKYTGLTPEQIEAL